MGEGKETPCPGERRAHEMLIERAIESAREQAQAEQTRAIVAATVELTEKDAMLARAALKGLLGDRAAQARLAAWLERSAEWALLTVGASFEMARRELATSAPDLEKLVDELVRWLEGGGSGLPGV
jgi:hypothetical protein